MDKIINDVRKIVETLVAVKNAKQSEVAKVLKKIIKESEEVFNLINNYQQAFMKRKDFSIDYYHEAQDKLTGCYMYLAPITGVIDALKKNRQEAYFVKKKLEFDDDKKFSAAAVNPEASHFVSEERLTRNIFQGYLDACMQGLHTCRNRIKEYENEKPLNAE